MTHSIFRLFLRIIVIGLLMLTIVWFKMDFIFKNYLKDSVFKMKHERKPNHTSGEYFIDTIGCKILRFQVPEDDFDINRSPVVCPGPPRLTKVVGTMLYVDQSIKADYYSNKIKRCQKWNVTRGNSDNSIILGKPTTFHNQTKIDAEFSFIKCEGVNNSVLYTDFYSRIIDKKHVQKKLKSQSGKRAEDIPLSVLLIGIDSTSHNSFSRQMPRLKKYLLETLKAYSFPGFTRVGENTFPNILALLSGKFLSETKWRSGQVYDSLDLIWKNYSSRNAITVMAEDHPYIAAFNYVARGFRKQPTDYYFRPLTIAMKNKFRNEFCVGPLPETDYVQHYMKQFLKKYKMSFYFALTFFTRWTHNHLHGAARWEDKLLGFFQWLHQSKILNNTLLFFFGDHGFRLGGFRTTVAGSHEANLPFLFFIVPEWFKIKHKSKADSVHRNQNRLVTFFDFYATLSENLNRGKQIRMMMSNRSISLMSPIPSNRTCKEAEIPAQFCECFSARKQVSVENVNVTQAANAVVKSLNKLLEKGKAKKCAKLKLKKIIRAFKYRSTYSVTLKVSPSEGIFQSLGEYRGKNFQPLGEILRINIYGNQSHCVKTRKLKPLCFCT
ncbi:uncharacterized protein LOC106874152 [Octopus bimaculoides]|uniref:Uncharacterized protein n=1 Tax=Octopus bimaculoides TaxID=37653 RepID=A0A0L8GXS5_OCTBM|nr:uncharacterized protein LOC106874152 [Octopus bimaculoides]|eukprot:XP_014777260.1 PREDICTED: uncharacterized protein LOC106874152 [Octopus bimaculoides]